MSTLMALGSAGLGLLAAMLSMTRVHAVHALLWLITALLALSAASFALGAGFAAILLILIYVGTIVVVFVFVVIGLDTSATMLAGERIGFTRARLLPSVIALLLGVPILFGLDLTGAPAPQQGAPVPAQAVGELLFGPWVVAVQLVTFMLLAALIGVRHLGRQQSPPGDRG